MIKSLEKSGLLIKRETIKNEEKEQGGEFTCKLRDANLLGNLLTVKGFKRLKIAASRVRQAGEDAFSAGKDF